MRKILIAGEKLGSRIDNFETCFQEGLFGKFKNRVGEVLEIEIDEETLQNLSYSRNWENIIGMIIDKYLEIRNDVSSKVGNILDISIIAKKIINDNADVMRDIMPKAA